MKIIHSLALFGLLAGVASAATYTSVGSWNVAISQSVIGTTLNFNGSQGSLSEASLAFFDPSAHPDETLTGVTINYSAPLDGQSPSIGATVSSASGSNTFTSLSASVQTVIDCPTLVTIFSNAKLDTSPFDVGAYQRTAGHNFVGGEPDLVVMEGSPISSNLTRTYSVNYFNATDSRTLAQFMGSGNMVFDVTSNVIASYIRTSAASDVNFGYAGVDSGTITVTYTTIPETSSAMLGGVGVLALLRRRR
ncbi:MAG: hypothetical protein WCJ66_04020 [Verrucomicrobiota bacterium]